MTDNIVDDIVAAGISSFLKANDKENTEKNETESGPDEPKTDIKELPENKAPDTEVPEVSDDAKTQDEADRDAEYFLGIPVDQASDAMIVGLLSNVLEAMNGLV